MISGLGWPTMRPHRRPPARKNRLARANRSLSPKLHGRVAPQLPRPSRPQNPLPQLMRVLRPAVAVQSPGNVSLLLRLKTQLPQKKFDGKNPAERKLLAHAPRTTSIAPVTAMIAKSDSSKAMTGPSLVMTMEETKGEPAVAAAVVADAVAEMGMP